MYSYPAGTFDAVVVGAGHAGCEAGLALSRIGIKTLILTINLDSVAFLACNPSIGGTAKGHIVREVDALGGEMGANADRSLLQLRMLNMGKGSAVHSLRAQADKNVYHTDMKKTLENTPGLELRQGEVTAVNVKNGKVCGVRCANGAEYRCRTVVLATGVYLKGEVITGEHRVSSGPSGFFPANELTKNLQDLGFSIRRFKTGTPARVDKRSVDFSKMEAQYSDDGVYPFSFLTEGLNYCDHPCYLTYTNEKTHEIIKKNLHRSPMYNGEIKGVGPRYCPSIESKVVRFADKHRHQIFIEPEGADTNEMYVQGMSTSMPPDVQEEMYRTIAGLEDVVIMRYAYAIEYDCIDSKQLYATLQYKGIEGVYTAGQINGSSGYEEAAGQGLYAGINAALYLQDKPPLVLGRSDAYIGVLVDDLVTKGTEEPYRMMTSRAEHRLHLRQDNADQRLTEIGRRVGLVTDSRYEKYLAKMESLTALKKEMKKVLAPLQTVSFMHEHGLGEPTGATTLSQLVKHPGITVQNLADAFPLQNNYTQEVLRQAEIELKYEGYLVKQQSEIARARKLEEKRLPQDIDYNSMQGIRLEARQKLTQVRPLNIGQASRISGVSPADIAVLMLSLKMKQR